MFRKLLFALFTLTSIATSSAYDFKYEGLYYNLLSGEDHTIEVTFANESYSNNQHYVSGDIKIPKKIIYDSKNYTVTAIGERAFQNCSSLTSVMIPNSVTAIGEGAFCDCSSLTSVTIPNSVTAIGKSAFGSCYSLTSVTIPNSVTTIGGHAFSGCSNLTSVTIPNSVTAIREWAFSGCSSLTSVMIPNSVTAIGEGAFNGCSRLTSVTIPNSVTAIEDWAFWGCSGLTSVTIGNSVTAIGESAFNGCTRLTSAKIPNSVTSIGNEAFGGCYRLYSVTIPTSVTVIGWRAFRGCSGLRSIYVHGEVPIKCNPEFPDNVIREAILYVPTGTLAAYEKVDPWRNFWNIEEMDYSGVTTVTSDNSSQVQLSVECGILTISGLDAGTPITIHDMQGRMVYSGTSHTITHLVPGLYILRTPSLTTKFSL